MNTPGDKQRKRRKDYDKKFTGSHWREQEFWDKKLKQILPGSQLSPNPFPPVDDGYGSDPPC